MGLTVLGLLVLFVLLVLAVGRGPAPAAARAVPLALAGAIAASLVVNDSPLDVLLVGSTGFVAAAAGMLPRRWSATSRSP
jgi:hypothetical protein